MKMKNYKWMSKLVGVGVVSIVAAIGSVSIVVAQGVIPLAGEQPVGPTVDEVRAFLKENAAFVIPEFNKVINGADKEHAQWMLKDISQVMHEHQALKAFDPKVAALFTQVLKLENELQQSLELKLKSGQSAEVAGGAVKAQLKSLIASRLELEKGQIAYRKHLLGLELAEVEKDSTKVDEITESELKILIEELKANKAEILER